MLKQLMINFFNAIMKFSVNVLNRVDPITEPSEEEINEIMESVTAKTADPIKGILSIKEFNEEVLLCTEEYMRAVQENDEEAIANYAKAITYLNDLAKVINDFEDYELN